MDTFPSPTTFSAEPSGSKTLPLIIISVVVGVVAVILAIVMVLALSQASKDRSTVNEQKAAAAAAARTDQKKIDDAAAKAAAESPYRTYTAPSEFGSFVIKFPKNWESYVNYSQSSQDNLDLMLHPNLITANNNDPQLLACRITMRQGTLDNYLQQFHNNPTVKQSDITVSGIKGKELTGIQDKRSIRTIALPVRDKTLLFTNEDNNFTSEFSTILAQSRIIP
jgi:hypothetical protein